MYQAEKYIIASSAGQAYSLLQENAGNTVIGGGMWLRMGKRSCNTIIDLSALGLDKIEEKEDCVELGAMVTLRQLETSAVLNGLYSNVFSKCASPIVGVQFRNMATLGGTVFGKYAFSDIIPVLLALDAQVTLYNAGTMPLESFMAKPAGRDLLLSVSIPKDGKIVSYETQRGSATDFGILNVCGARLKDGQWRLFIGARPGASVRCTEAEECLASGDIDGAASAVQKLSYSDNIRASGSYRRVLAEVMTRRIYKEIEEAKA